MDSGRDRWVADPTRERTSAKRECESQGVDKSRSELWLLVGWSRDGDVQEQIDATVESGVQLARSRLSEGESSMHCKECGVVIPEARREAIPGVRLCVRCQSELEKGHKKAMTLFNRAGSKDSQLK